MTWYKRCDFCERPLTKEEGRSFTVSIMSTPIRWLHVCLPCVPRALRKTADEAEKKPDAFMSLEIRHPAESNDEP